MRLPTLAVTAALALSSGCSEPGATQLDEDDAWRSDVFALPVSWWFNNKLRPDSLPLDASQAAPDEDPLLPFEPLFLSAGGPLGTAIASDISLNRTGEYAADPLNNAACLWLSPSDEIKLHWESSARFATLAGEPPLATGRDDAGFCTFTDPYTRLPLVDVDGNAVNPPNPGAEPHHTVRVERRTMGNYGAFFNPYDECIVPPAGPTPATATGACYPTFTGEYASCNGTGCEFAVDGDAQFELSNVLDGVVENTKTVEPVIKRVSGTRQLVRPLTYDPTNGLFAWSVDKLPDGRWSENFSTNVKVTNIRVFGLMPTGPRAYLRPIAGTIGSIGCQITARPDFSLLCNGQDPATVDVTPAYLHNTPGQRIAWTVEFATDPRQGVIVPDGPCCEGTQEQCCDAGICPPMCGSEDGTGKLDSQLYIEFTLVDLEHAEPDLFASPSSLEFGPVEWGSSWRQQVAIENTGGVSMDVIKVALEGNWDGAFSVVPPATVGFPHSLAPKDRLLVHVLANSQAHAYEPTANLVVTALDPASGQTLESSVALRYEPYSGPLLETAWSKMDETGGEIHLCEDAERLGLFVGNFGDRVLERSAYTIQGPNASQFEVKGTGVTTLDQRDMPPGDADALAVTFTPDPSGPREQVAELVFDGNARNTPDGDLRIPLVGFLDSWENQPTCTPTK